MEVLFELLFALIECLVEMMCMGAKGRWILFILLTIIAVIGFGVWTLSYK
ncbi:membrane protein [Cronobacter phage vB_CsaM_GAP32]|uniref:Putative membrane protein n=1 Tax=Cronobacter phage vB_CsaM_GAP32 TaxID=1141136 RepID=K4F9H9_9CAUD|nr:membrane protein [Cronobacter phage vB_CsaM_GAP32]AFC21575.1 putative membrane protein [Cronobacter phage vB_CsaM_GAP32]